MIILQDGDAGQRFKKDLFENLLEYIENSEKQFKFKTIKEFKKFLKDIIKEIK